MNSTVLDSLRGIPHHISGSLVAAIAKRSIINDNSHFPVGPKQIKHGNNELPIKVLRESGKLPVEDAIKITLTAALTGKDATTRFGINLTVRLDVFVLYCKFAYPTGAQ